MTNAKHWTITTGKVVAAIVLVFSLPVAHAVQISATTTFDNIFSTGPTSGNFFLTSGGSTTTIGYAGNSATPNELTGPLTNFLDGTGFNGTASATDDAFIIGFDTVISVLNDTGIAQTVRFRLDYSNMVNADGPDAYAQSNFFLFDDINPGDLFSSHLMSDSLNGDENGGLPINLDPIDGSYGEVLMESGSMIFSYDLDHLETVDLTMRWELDGGDFSGGLDDLAEASLSANLTIVPLPGALLFMVSGLLLLPLQRLLRKK